MRETSANPHNRLAAFDLLRLLAALAVVLFHYAFRGANASQTIISLPAFDAVARYGYLGVQLFFVISGFVIAYSAEGRSPVAFGISRFARIYPTFLLCATITFVITILFGSPYLSASLSQWLGNLIIAAPALKQEFLDGSYWSIVYEVVFYSWVFLLLMVGTFRREYYGVIVVGWLLISVVNQAFIHSGLLKHLFLTDQSAFFCIGLLLYAQFRGQRDRALYLLLALSIAVAINQSLVLAEWNRANYYVEYSDWIVVLACLSIVAITALATRIRSLPLPTTLVLAAGGLTYPLYLLHQQIGYVALNRFAESGSPLMLIAITTIGMIAFSYLVWRYFERHAQPLVKSACGRIQTRLESGWLRPAASRAQI
jgi:peptidoglycan/LPS O-acetylase OafA/YrhL